MDEFDFQSMLNVGNQLLRNSGYGPIIDIIDDTIESFINDDNDDESNKNSSSYDKGKKGNKIEIPHAIFDMNDDNEYHYLFSVPSGINKKDITVTKTGNILKIIFKRSPLDKKYNHQNMITSEIMIDNDSEDCKEMVLQNDAKQIKSIQFVDSVHQLIVIIEKITEKDSQKMGFE